METRLHWRLAMLKILMIPVMLVITVVSSAVAVDTLDVKSTLNGPWTEFSSEFFNGYRRSLGATDGSLWWGMNRGVVRYDGKAWITFTSEEFPIGSVRSIAQDRNGTIWFSGNRTW